MFHNSPEKTEHRTDVIIGAIRNFIAEKREGLRRKTGEGIQSAREAVKSNWESLGHWASDQAHYYIPRTLGVMKVTIDRFHQTVMEGHYREKPSSFWVSVLKPKDKKGTPETDPVFAGGLVLSKAMMFANRFIIGGLFAILAMNTMLAVGVGLTVFGLGLYGYEYWRSRHTRQDVITEVNFAGQEVEGRRADLCRLYQAQMRLMNIAGAFKIASHQTTCDTVQEIINEVEPIRKRVKVLKAGKYGARADIYDFSEPHLKLVFDDHLYKPGIPAGPLHTLDLKRAWIEKADKHYDTVIDKIMELESVLPPDVAERLQQRRQEQSAAPRPCTPLSFAPTKH